MYGNGTLPDLRRRSGQSQGGCTGITMGGRIRPCSTEARGNIDVNKHQRWLDFRGALQILPALYWKAAENFGLREFVENV